MTNLTQIIEKGIGDFRKKFVREIDGGEVLAVRGVGVTAKHPDPEEVQSFLSEKIRQSYEAGWSARWEHEMKRLENIIDSKLNQ